MNKSIMVEGKHILLGSHVPQMEEWSFYSFFISGALKTQGFVQAI